MASKPRKPNFAAAAKSRRWARSAKPRTATKARRNPRKSSSATKKVRRSFRGKSTPYFFLLVLRADLGAQASRSFRHVTLQRELHGVTGPAFLAGHETELADGLDGRIV